jgi:hypothetical protein
VNSLPPAPIRLDQFWEGALNIDIICPFTTKQGIPMTLYSSDLGLPGPPDRPDDELVLEAYEIEEFEPGRMQFVPGSPIEGRFTFTGFARIPLSGLEQPTRARIEGCFRLPAACPVQAFGGVPALCP